MIVADASVVVAALIDGGARGAWARDRLAGRPLAAPHLMPAEAGNILRRAALNGDVGAESASMAHADLLDLAIELFPYERLGPRVWELRGSVTIYDGWYVALAETLDVPLVTLDARLTRAAGPRCSFEVPS